MLRWGASPPETPSSFRLTGGGLLMEAATVRERHLPGPNREHGLQMYPGTWVTVHWISRIFEFS